MDIHGPWKSIDVHGHDWKSKKIYGYPLKFNDIHGNLRYLYKKREIHGNPWMSLDPLIRRAPSSSSVWDYSIYPPINDTIPIY